MTHAEALEECARLGREHPERASVSWLPRETAPGEWQVVRLGFAAKGGRTTPSVHAPPEPPHPEEPQRPPQWLNP